MERKYKLLSIEKSPRYLKKYVATFVDNDGNIKKTHFGASGYTDYTMSKNRLQAESYRRRHRKDLETNDPTRAGFLSYYILWDTPDFHENIRRYKNRFNM